MQGTKKRTAALVNRIKSGNTGLFICVFALLAGAQLYYLYNTAVTAVLFAGFLAGCYFFIFKPGEVSAAAAGPDYAGRFMKYAALAFIVLHFTAVFEPVNFLADEWVDIMGSYMFLNGDRGFFHYLPADGSSLPFFYRAVIIALMYLTKSIDYLRLIPHVFFLAGCLGFYLLGKEIKGRALGIAMLFVYAVSSFSFYSAAQLVPNSLVVSFMAFCLYFFLLHLRTARVLHLVLSGAIFFLGFYTYSTWVYSLPFWAAAVFIYRRELGVKKTAASAAVMVLSFAVFAVLLVMNPRTITRFLEWPAGFSDAAGMLRFVLEKLTSLVKLFSAPLDSVYTFSTVLPMLSWPELLLLSGGCAVMLASGEKIHRLLAAGLIFSSLTLFTHDSTYSHLRHVVLIFFVPVVSGFFMEYIGRKKYAAVFMALLMSFSIYVVADMRLNWQQRIKTGGLDAAISKYIEAHYKDGNYILLHELSPYGHYGTALRLAGGGQAGKNPGQALILSGFFMKDALKQTFKAEFKQLFHDEFNASSMPVALYEADISAAYPGERFLEMKKKLAKVNLMMWDYNYAGVFEEAAAAETKNPRNPEATFINTVLRVYCLEAGFAVNDADRLYGLFYNDTGSIFITADFLYYRGKTAMSFGDTGSAAASYREAARLAPWWGAPVKRLKQLQEK